MTSKRLAYQILDVEPKTNFIFITNSMPHVSTITTYNIDLNKYHPATTRHLTSISAHHPQTLILPPHSHYTPHPTDLFIGERAVLVNGVDLGDLGARGFPLQHSFLFPLSEQGNLVIHILHDNVDGGLRG